VELYLPESEGRLVKYLKKVCCKVEALLTMIGATTTGS
jgi:hypothetical protein